MGHDAGCGVPSLDTASTGRAGDASLDQVSLDDFGEDDHGISEGEERGEIEMSGEEVGGDEFSSSVDSLTISLWLGMVTPCKRTCS